MGAKTTTCRVWPRRRRRISRRRCVPSGDVDYYGLVTIHANQVVVATLEDSMVFGRLSLTIADDREVELARGRRGLTTLSSAWREPDGGETEVLVIVDAAEAGTFGDYTLDVQTVDPATCEADANEPNDELGEATTVTLVDDGNARQASVAGATCPAASTCWP